MVQQRRLEVIVLLPQNLKFFFLDEPAAGMNHKKRQNWLIGIRRIKIIVYYHHAD